MYERSPTCYVGGALFNLTNAPLEKLHQRFQEGAGFCRDIEFLSFDKVFKKMLAPLCAGAEPAELDGRAVFAEDQFSHENADGFGRAQKSGFGMEAAFAVLEREDFAIAGELSIYECQRILIGEQGIDG